MEIPWYNDVTPGMNGGGDMLAIYQRLNRVKLGNTAGNTGLNPSDATNLTIKQGSITYITGEGKKYLWECLGKVKPGNTQEVKDGNTVELKPTD